jgi:hypothetical protein
MKWLAIGFVIFILAWYVLVALGQPVLTIRATESLAGRGGSGSSPFFYHSELLQCCRVEEG